MKLQENRGHLLSKASYLLAGLLLFFSAACPPGTSGSEPSKTSGVKERQLPGGYPTTPSLPPAFSIPIESLGFSAPGPLYLGERNAMASLDFVDENRLLLTFRVPGLIRRNLKPGDTSDSDARQIRAVVLNISTGAVESEALWAVHDRARYLWMLKNGHFLLRDRENLS